MSDDPIRSRVPFGIAARLRPGDGYRLVSGKAGRCWWWMARRRWLAVGLATATRNPVRGMEEPSVLDARGAGAGVACAASVSSSGVVWGCGAVPVPPERLGRTPTPWTGSPFSCPRWGTSSRCTSRRGSSRTRGGLPVASAARRPGETCRHGCQGFRG